MTLDHWRLEFKVILGYNKMRSRFCPGYGAATVVMKEEQQRERERGRKRLLIELSCIHPLNKKIAVDP